MQPSRPIIITIQSGVVIFYALLGLSNGIESKLPYQFFVLQ
jgi:hypothetical protein